MDFLNKQKKDYIEIFKVIKYYNISSVTKTKKNKCTQY